MSATSSDTGSSEGPPESEALEEEPGAGVTSPDDLETAEYSSKDLERPSPSPISGNEETLGDLEKALEKEQGASGSIMPDASFVMPGPAEVGMEQMGNPLSVESIERYNSAYRAAHDAVMGGADRTIVEAALKGLSEQTEVIYKEALETGNKDLANNVADTTGILEEKLRDQLGDK